MSSVSSSINTNEILVSEALSPWARHIVELSKAYGTIILLYEDDLSDNLLAAWAETDRLKLSIRKVGQALGGIDVYTFGMDDLPKDTAIELHLREASQTSGRQDASRSAYKSLLNELILIQVKLLPGASNDNHLK